MWTDRGTQCSWDWLPLLPLQIVVVAVQSLQVKLGILQLRRQFLTLLPLLLLIALRILIICLQISQLQHTHTQKHIYYHFLWQFNAYHYRIYATNTLQVCRILNRPFFKWLNIIESVLPSCQHVSCSAAPSPSSHQTPEGVSSWWTLFPEWLCCILSATRLLQEKTQNTERKACEWHVGVSYL